MNEELNQVEQRVKRYWYSDGIADITGGAMLILLCGYFAAQGYVKENSLINGLLQSGLVVLMIAATFGARWVVNTLKARVTYPRTGYVQYRVDPQTEKYRRWALALIAMMLASAMVFLSNSIQIVDSLLLTTGLVVGIIFVVLRGKSSGIKRFYILGGLSLVLGIILSLIIFPQAYKLAIFYGVLGIASAISGLLVLRAYLHDNPFPAESDHGR